MKITMPKNRYKSEAQKTDLQKVALFAMQRAAEEARNIAIQTNTAIVVKVDGKIQRISAAELKEQQIGFRS